MTQYSRRRDLGALAVGVTGWAKNVSRKFFIHIFAKYWPIFSFFLWKIYNKVVTK